MNIEDELRGALDVSAPPPTTTLDLVVKRGRRRVFAQRAGAVLGVFAVVAGIGIGATTLNQAASGPQQADLPDASPTSVERALTWPRVNTPPRTPTGTWSPSSTTKPPAGNPVGNVPMCDIEQPSKPRDRGLGAEQLAPDLIARWRDQIRTLLPEVTLGEVEDYDSTVLYSFDVSDSLGAGSVRIWAGRFSGAPLAAADAGLWETGDCEPPRRHVQPNGAVLQLHSVRPKEQYISQSLSVYRADGLLVQLEVRTFSSAVFESGRAHEGRSTLPLSEEQLARLGPIFAEVG